MAAPSRRHQVNSWLGVGLLCSITLWVTFFYVYESKKILEGKLVTDYAEYYDVTAALK